MELHKTLMILSITCGAVGLFLGLGVMYADQFTAVGSEAIANIGGKAASVTMFSLYAGKTETTMYDFCSSDDSICGHDCMAGENELCALRDTTVTMMYLMFLLVGLHAIGLLAVATDMTSALYIRPDRSGAFGKRIAWLQILAALLGFVVLILWGTCKSALPDLNSAIKWMYLPASEGLNWGVSYGYILLIFVVVLEMTSAVCGFMGSKTLADTQPAEESVSCFDWDWKTQMISSAFCSFLCLLCNFGVMFSSSFVGEAQNKRLQADMYTLKAGGVTESFSEVCSTGSDHASTTEHEFCDTTVTSMTLIWASGVATLCHMVVALVLCCCSAELKEYAIVPKVSTGLQGLAALMAMVLVPVWGSVKGELPDYNAEGKWIHLPEDQSVAWRLAGGYAMLFPMCVMAILATALGVFGSLAMQRPSAETLLENEHYADYQESGL